MADNNDLLHQIRTIVREENEPLKQAQAQTNTRVDALAVGQAQTNTNLSQIKTTVESLEAGQEDIREKMATKADIHRLEQKIDKVEKGVKSHASRIENLEEHTGIPNPHKTNPLLCVRRLNSIIKVTFQAIQQVFCNILPCHI